MFPPLTDHFANPNERLACFTNRLLERAEFERAVNVPAGQPLPLLMFYGVGGCGKSWLLHRLQQDAGELPTAFVDLDSPPSAGSLLTDSSRVLAEIRRQFGAKLPCPRFDLAYTWLRYREGGQDEPHFKGGGLLGHAWELVVEAGSAAASDVPGASIVAWFVKKSTGPVKGWLQESGVGDWLATTFGQEDFLALKAMTPGDIRQQLHRRFLLDLKEHLPEVRGRACRAVVLIDAVEALQTPSESVEGVLEKQHIVRELYHPEAGLLVVMAGQNRLRWVDSPTSSFPEPQLLHQHLIEGLAENDARDYLALCGIDDASLQEAILRTSVDEHTAKPELSGHHYHAFSLGLCVDTFRVLARQGGETDPSAFYLPASNPHEVARRFLRTIRSDGTLSIWLRRLAIPLAFDEVAARAAFSESATVEQDFAWSSLAHYSFVRDSSERGWYSLHAKMRQALIEIERADDRREWRRHHSWWDQHWRSRAAHRTDAFSAKAWYHSWHLDPPKARRDWAELARLTRESSRMAEHHRLLSWWEGCDLWDRLEDPDFQKEAALALNSIGVEFSKASLGARDDNLRFAISCHKSALRVFGENDFPYQWAAAQNNLGAAYAQLPTGDLEKNLSHAIELHEEALRVFTRERYPTDWAMTLTNIAAAFGDQRSSDRVRSLQNAINYYESALEVLTEEQEPVEWATVKTNLGAIYADVPSDDGEVTFHKAIDASRDALRVFTKERHAETWAGIQNNLATVFCKLKAGDLRRNLRKAIDYYRAALSVFTPEAFPQRWATIQHNLGTTYCSLPSGDPEADLKQALRHLRAALKVRTEVALPLDWAETQYQLGVAILCLETDSAELRTAKKHFQNALRFLTMANALPRWAAAQAKLGHIDVQLMLRGETDAKKDALKHLLAGLRGLDESKHPNEWAQVHTDLATIYLHGNQGDRREEAEDAISHLEAAARVRSRDRFQHEWAILHNMMGIAHDLIAKGSKQDHAKHAVEHFQNALQIFTHHANPEQWATVQYNLGLALYGMTIGRREENLAKAIDCFEAAATVYTPEKSQERHRTLMELLQSAREQLSSTRQ